MKTCATTSKPQVDNAMVVNRWANDEVKNCLLVIYYGLRMACCRYKQMTMSYYCDSIASRCGIFKRGRRQRSVNYHSAVFIFRVSALPLSLRHSVFQWANKKRNLSCADYQFNPRHLLKRYGITYSGSTTHTFEITIICTHGLWVVVEIILIKQVLYTNA